MMVLDLLVASGGVLSHAPSRAQTAAMLVDAFQPEGVTQLAVDSIFMMPHLGVLASVDEPAAAEVFERDCIIYLGTCAAPSGGGKPGDLCATYELHRTDGPVRGELRCGELCLLPLGDGEEAEMTISPARGRDAGSGPGQEHRAKVRGGVVGLILDGRGRPLELPEEGADRRARVAEWSGALGLYGETD